MIEEKKAAFVYDELLGDEFSSYLKVLGLTPKTLETSWEFRQRAFPIIWKNSPRLAMSFLILLRHIDWLKENKARYLSLVSANPSKEKLEKFVKKFSSDPVVMRNYRAVTDWMVKNIIRGTEPILPPPSPAEPDERRPSKGKRVSSRLVDLPPGFSEKWVVELVAREFGVTAEDMFSRNKTSKVVLARQVAIYLLREYGLSFPQIGNFFERDHTTAVHAYQRINEQEKSDRELVRALENIHAELSVIRSN